MIKNTLLYSVEYKPMKWFRFPFVKVMMVSNKKDAVMTIKEVYPKAVITKVTCHNQVKGK